MCDEGGSNRRIKLGVVGVDSGALVIVDPCNLESEWTRGSADQAIAMAIAGFGGQLNYKMGHPGLAVAFRSGFGDGTYEVWATIRDCGKWGERVAKVEVIFISDDTGGEEEEAEDGQ